MFACYYPAFLQKILFLYKSNLERRKRTFSKQNNWIFLYVKSVSIKGSEQQRVLMPEKEGSAGSKGRQFSYKYFFPSFQGNELRNLILCIFIKVKLK